MISSRTYARLNNGRRIASSGANAIGGQEFVDVNTIPAAAIDRVEVLTDGASAIYGADAVGGVVNIILKSNYHGIESGVRYGGANGDYRERSAYIVGGFGNKDANITATASWSSTSPLFQSQRPFSSNLVGQLTKYPGVADGALLNPNLNSPSQTNATGSAAVADSLADLIGNGTYLAGNNPRIAPGISSQFDLSPYQTLLLQQEQSGLTLDGSAKLIGSKLEVFGDYILAQTKSFNQTFQAGNNLSTVTVPADSPYNPLTTAFPGVVAGDLDEPLQTRDQATANRVTLGLRGEITSNWNWESAFTYSDNELTQHLDNVVYLPNLPLAIAGGYDASGNPIVGGAYSRVYSGFFESNSNFVIQPALNPFARAGVDPASEDNVLGVEVIRAWSKLSSVDAKVVGTLFRLPAGSLGAAVGAAFRRETLGAEPDSNSYYNGPTAQSWGGGYFFNPFSGSRNVTSAYAEVRVPITSASYPLPAFHAFDISVAGRAEHYSDAGNARVPKFGLRWQPFDDEATFRFTYSKSFNAPTLYNTEGPNRVTLSSPTILATQLGNPAFAGQIYNELNESNPNLKPATAWSRSFGLVLRPKFVKGLSVTVDYRDVSEEGFQSGNGGVLSSVDALGPASPYANLVAFDNYPGKPGAVYVTAPHQLSDYLLAGGDGKNIYTVGYFVNLGGYQVHATDVTIDYIADADGWGLFELNSIGTYLNSYKFQAYPGTPAYQYAGFATNNGVGVEGTMPKYRLYSTLNWSWKQWEASIANTYIPSVTDIGPGGSIFYSNPNAVSKRVDRYITDDAQLSYTLQTEAWRRSGRRSDAGVRFAIGVNNIFNRMPPLSPQAFPDNRADISTYSPIGRLIFGSVTCRF